MPTNAHPMRADSQPRRGSRLDTRKPERRRSTFLLLLGVLSLCGGWALGSGRGVGEDSRADGERVASDDRGTLRRVLEVGPEVELEVHCPRGQLEIHGWDRDELRIEVVWGSAREELEIEEDPSRVRVRIVSTESSEALGRGSRGSAQSSDPERSTLLKIWGPKALSLQAVTTSAAMVVTDLQGRIGLETLSGHLSLDVQSSELEIATIAGMVDLRGSADRFSIETVSGAVRVRAQVPEIEAESVNARLDLDAGTVERASIRSLSGHVHLAARLGSKAVLDLESHSGRLELEVPPQTSASFELSTFGGQIRSELEASRDSSATEPDDRGPGRELRFTAGAGEAQVRMSSFSGTLVVTESLADTEQL